MSTSAPECARCGRPDPTRGYICTTCTDKVARQLRQLADLAGDVETTVARQARTGPPTAGGVTADPAEPANRTAADAEWTAGNTLVVWMGEVARLRGVPLPARPVAGWQIGPVCLAAERARHGHRPCPHRSCTEVGVMMRDGRLAKPMAATTQHPIARAALWLVDHLDWLRHRAEADDALAELEYAAAIVRRTVDTRSPRWYAGPCGGTATTGAECLADLYGLVGAEILRCGACGSWTYAADRRAWLLDRMEDVLGTAAQLAAAATALGHEGVTSARIRGYAHRGRIVAHGVDQWARPTYRFGDVLDLVGVPDTPRDQSRVHVA